MIVCDICSKEIENTERHGFPTKDDPYGELTDWCKKCWTDLNEEIQQISEEYKDQRKIAVDQAIERAKNKYRPLFSDDGIHFENSDEFHPDPGAKNEETFPCPRYKFNNEFSLDNMAEVGDSVRFDDAMDAACYFTLCPSFWLLVESADDEMTMTEIEYP